MKHAGVGDPFPDFELLDQDGATMRLADLKGAPCVIYFYPRDDTPGCTAQACAFRDQFEAFTDAGAAVVGISDDSPKRHKAFADKHRLPFRLLSDRGGRFRAAVGVPKSLGLIPGRVTYVLDADGVIQHIYRSQSKATSHIPEALAALA